MSDTTQHQQPGEQPATDGTATQTDPTPNGEQPQDFAAQLENLSPAELAQALSFDMETDADPDDDGGITPAAPEAPDLAQSEPVKPEGEDTSPQPINRRRLSVSGLSDEDRALAAQAIALVRSGKASNITQAIVTLVGEQAQATPGDDDSEPAPTDPPAAPASQAVETLRQQLTELREQRRAAKADFDVEEETRLTDAIEDLQIDILRAEQAATVEQSATATYEQEYQTAVEEMEAKYEALLDDPNSPFAEFLDDAVLAARARKAPELADPRHIIAMADKIAARLGKAPATSTAPRTPAPVPPPPARRPAGSAVAPSGQPKPQLIGRQADEAILRASKEDLAAALWG